MSTDDYIAMMAHQTIPVPPSCEFCDRTIAACNEDVHGCGSTGAGDDATVERLIDSALKPETWRDRPPLL